MRQRLIYPRALCRVGQRPGCDKEGARDLLHLPVINLVGRIGRQVVILVQPGEPGKDGNAFLQVRDVVAPRKKELIVHVVAAVIQLEIQIRAVDGLTSSLSSVRKRRSCRSRAW
jgi:hypothetical protein